MCRRDIRFLDIASVTYRKKPTSQLHVAGVGCHQFSDFLEVVQGIFYTLLVLHKGAILGLGAPKGIRAEVQTDSFDQVRDRRNDGFAPGNCGSGG